MAAAARKGRPTVPAGCYSWGSAGGAAIPDTACATRKVDRFMRYRSLGRTGWKVSEVSFGAWAIGGTWGPVTDSESLAALHKAV